MRLALDAHIPAAVAVGLTGEGVDCVIVPHWQAGDLRNADDDRLLVAASAEGRVFVTYDLRTVPDMLQRWAAEERHHAGVILVDEHTVPPGDRGGLLRALRRAIQDWSDLDWTDRCVFLPRPP